MRFVLLVALSALAACEGVKSVPPDAKSDSPGVAGSCILDLDKIKPIGSQFKLNRNPDSKQELHVLPACSGGSEGLKVYWFVNYDVEKPTKWAFEGDPITLTGCAPALSEEGLDTYVIEALITAGTLKIELTSDGDARYTEGGEPMQLVRWTVTMNGTPACGPAPR